MAAEQHRAARAMAVAGLFYPSDPQQCAGEAQRYLDVAKGLGEGRWIGALVPHAGWICSGAVAAEGIKTLRQGGAVDVAVIFGAVHTPGALRRAALDEHDAWQVPGGSVAVATELRDRLAAHGELFEVSGRHHQREHAIEVELPLVRAAFPDAKVLPIGVPPVEAAAEIGRQVARAVAEAGATAVYLASSDLTHYGPAYGFAPAGTGEAALEWALENDRRLLRIVTDMQAERVVPEVSNRLNACGAGAIAALIGACREAGAKTARLVRHTNSYQTLAGVMPQPAEDAVGYAAVVFG